MLRVQGLREGGTKFYNPGPGLKKKSGPGGPKL
jgi:hypothetical protein